MVICRELSKLPKPISIKSVNFRNTVPGSPDALLTPASSLSSYLPRNLLVDSAHPAAFLPRYAHKTFPSFRSNILGIQAYPKALLTRPEVEWPDPPFKRVKHSTWQERIDNNVDGLLNGGSKDNSDGGRHGIPNTGSVEMAMLSVLGKKVHKKAVVRNKIITRLKTAISLLVVRGADAKHIDGTSKLTFNNEGKQWILPDWAYIFFPTIEIYRLPYSELVRTLRQALGTIYDSGLSMELSWRDFAKEQSLSIKERTVGVTKRYKQTHAPRPQKPNIQPVGAEYPNAARVQTDASILELPRPPKDTFSLFDDPPAKSPAILSKSKTDKVTQGLNPERPWARFDFGFDTVLGGERVSRGSDESRSPTTSSSRQVSESFFPSTPTPTPELVSSKLGAHFPRGSKRQKLLRSSLDMTTTSSRSIEHRNRYRSARPHAIHVNPNPTSIPEKVGIVDKSKPDAESRQPEVTLFQKKPIFIRHLHRMEKE